jgi:hypothetical protein
VATPTDELDPAGTLEELELAAVEAALLRVTRGTFGACAACGDAIEVARLAAIPWSRCCAACVCFLEEALGTCGGDACPACVAARRSDVVTSAFPETARRAA